MECASPGTPRLSVAMIVRNCSQRLAATLASICELADEIVILDTGSTDDTPVVALQAGATVHRREWDDDFAAARNACLERVAGYWVLWLDAGETIEADQFPQIRSVASDDHRTDRAYLLNVALPVAAGRTGREQIACLRLHPRLMGLRFGGRVRERLDESLAAHDIRIDSLPCEIRRGSEQHDPAEKTAKAQRNIRLADLQMAEHGPSAPLHNVLGEAFQTLGDQVRAAQHYRRGLDLAEGESTQQLEAYYGLLSCLEGVTADRSDQLALCMRALDHFPLDAQLLVALGGYLQALGQASLAVRSFDLAFRHGKIEPRIWHLPQIREIGASCAATVLMQSRGDEQARTLLEAAVTIYPQSERLALQLIELHVRSGRRTEALSIAAALSAPAQRERLSAAIRGSCLAQQERWAAAADLLQAAVLDGCRERYCLRWLVVSWLALERPRDAQTALALWNEIDPGSDELADLQKQITAQIASLPEPRSDVLRVDDAAQPATGPARRPAPSVRPSSRSD